MVALDTKHIEIDNGNRVTANGQTYTTGDNNQLLSDGTYTYQYDLEGNRTAKFIDADESGTISTGDTEITEYAWDHRNRLSMVVHYDTFADYVAEESDQIVEYGYDYQNRLIARTLDPDGTSGATAVEQSFFVHDGNQIALQFDKTGSGDLAATDMSHRYLWNPQAVDQLFADEQIHWDAQAENFITDDLLWALTDHLNSVRDLATYDAILDETTVENHRVFNAFGKLTSETNSSVVCVFGYTGRYFDPITVLQNNLNRWYDVLVGSWISEDPTGYETGDANLYRYVGNSPLIYTDPMGLYYVMAVDFSDLTYGAVVGGDAYYKWNWQPFYVLSMDSTGNASLIALADISILQKIKGYVDTYNNGGDLYVRQDWHYNEIFAGNSIDFQELRWGPLDKCDSGTLHQEGEVWLNEKSKSKNTTPAFGTHLDSSGELTEDRQGWAGLLGFGWVQQTGYPKTTQSYVPSTVSNAILDKGTYDFTGYEKVATHSTTLTYETYSDGSSWCRVEWTFSLIDNGITVKTWSETQTSKTGGGTVKLGS